MQYKRIGVGHDSRDEAIEGAKILALAVKSTLGNNGMNFLLEKGSRITNDGYTISKEIASGLEDEFQRRGAIAIDQAANKTNEEIGDFTSTAITLCFAILEESLKYLGSSKTIGAKKTHTEIREQIEKERLEVTEKITKMAKPIKTEKQLIDCAIVSVEDKNLGQLIGKMQWELGKDGVIVTEETNDKFSSIERVMGIRYDNGFSTSLVINNVEKQTLELNDAKTIITNHTVQNLAPLKNVMSQLYKSGCRNLIIMARGFTEFAIKECQENIKQGFNIFPINAPYTDHNEVMKDIVSVVGGTHINSESKDLADVQASDVGFAIKLVAGRMSSIITGKDDAESQARVATRVADLNKQLSKEPSDFQKKLITERIAMLTSGFAVLKVGAVSVITRGYLKDKADDSVNTVRACLQMGVVPGAGQALKAISDKLPDDYLLKKPLLSIYEQIKSSTTSKDDFIVPAWVQDSAKGLIVALKHAADVASTFGSVGGVIATKNSPVRYMVEGNAPQSE